jgi:protein-disulfide isomerase
MKKTILVILSALVLVSGLVLWINQAFVDSKTDQNVDSEKSTQNDSNNAGDKNSTGEADVSNQELIIGSPAAPATIVEYGDFKCPQCNKFHHNAGAEIRKKYIDTGKAKLVFRNLPFIADDSRTAAQGAFCAQEQSKFTIYHDTLYNYIWDKHYSSGDYSAESKNIFGVDKLPDILKDTSIDTVKMRQCLESQRYKAAVDADLKQSETDNATGTPFFVISNREVVGSQPFTVYKALIELQL